MNKTGEGQLPRRFFHYEIVGDAHRASRTEYTSRHVGDAHRASRKGYQ